MSRQVGNVTISSGTAVSDAYDCGSEYTLVGILVPATWTTADITIAGAVHPGITPAFGATPELRDSLTYSPVYDQTGTEFKVTVGATGDKLIAIPDNFLEGVQFLKIRSGTVAVPVNQAADRIIRLVVSE